MTLELLSRQTSFHGQLQLKKESDISVWKWDRIAYLRQHATKHHGCAWPTYIIVKRAIEDIFFVTICLQFEGCRISHETVVEGYLFGNTRMTMAAPTTVYRCTMTHNYDTQLPNCAFACQDTHTCVLNHTQARTHTHTHTPYTCTHTYTHRSTLSTQRQWHQQTKHS